MNTFLRAACAAFALSLVIPASVTRAEAATLVDQGDTTFDTGTGLTWLDVNLTAALSYVTVDSTLLGAGQTYAGYRHATASEVSALLAGQGISQGITFGPNAETAAFLNLITLLGPTDSSPNIDSLFGFLADSPSAGNRNISFLYFDPNGDQLVTVLAGTIPETQSSPSTGHFLVRDAETPLPAALPLFAGGLGVITLLARRRKAVKTRA